MGGFVNPFQASSYLARQYDKRWAEVESIVMLSKFGRSSGFEISELRACDNPVRTASYMLTKCAGCDSELVEDQAAVEGALRISRTLLTHTDKLVSLIETREVI